MIGPLTFRRYFSDFFLQNKYFNLVTKHGEIEELPCPNEGCDRLFQNKVQLTAHVYQIHTRIKEKVQCTECGKEFQNPGTYINYY